MRAFTRKELKKLLLEAANANSDDRTRFLDVLSSIPETSREHANLYLLPVVAILGRLHPVAVRRGFSPEERCEGLLAMEIFDRFGLVPQDGRHAAGDTQFPALVSRLKTALEQAED